MTRSTLFKLTGSFLQSSCTQCFRKLVSTNYKLHNTNEHFVQIDSSFLPNSCTQSVLACWFCPEMRWTWQGALCSGWQVVFIQAMDHHLEHTLNSLSWLSVIMSLCFKLQKQRRATSFSLGLLSSISWSFGKPCIDIVFGTVVYPDLQPGTQQRPGILKIWVGKNKSEIFYLQKRTQVERERREAV